MNVVLFKGDGPCPACKQVIAELDGAGIQFELDEDNAHLFYVGKSVGARTRPILVWYAVGVGVESRELIERMANG